MGSPDQFKIPTFSPEEKKEDLIPQIDKIKLENIDQKEWKKNLQKKFRPEEKIIPKKKE